MNKTGLGFFCDRIVTKVALKSLRMDLGFKKILQNSQHVILAHENNQLIGFINAISDGVLSAYIPLLEVLPSYQGQGIGKELTRRMLNELESYYMVDLSCDDKVVPFYEKLGLQKNNSMFIRNYKFQSGRN